MCNTILLPTTGSSAITAVVDHAIELPTKFDATVHGFYEGGTGGHEPAP